MMFFGYYQCQLKVFSPSHLCGNKGQKVSAHFGLRSLPGIQIWVDTVATFQEVSVILLAYFLWPQPQSSPFCHLRASVSFMANLVKLWPFPTHHHIQEEQVVCRAQTCDRRRLSMWVSNPPSWAAWGEGIPWCFTVSTWLHFTSWQRCTRGPLSDASGLWFFRSFSYYCIDVIQRKVIFLLFSSASLVPWSLYLITVLLCLTSIHRCLTCSAFKRNTHYPVIQTSWCKPPQSR